MSIVNRFEEVRKRENLNKSQFERKISKSTGYLNMLIKRDSNPGVDVIGEFAKSFPHYNLNWLLTGNGSMLTETKSKSTTADLKEPGHNYDNASLQRVKEEIREDLNQLAKGMAKNFEVMAKGMQTSIQRQEIIIDFVEKLDADRISKATGNLEEFLKSK